MLGWLSLIFIGIKYIYFSSPPAAPTLIKSYQHRPKKKPHLEIYKYFVKSGENLWNISKKFNISINTIAWANDLENLRIYPHQQLLIPNQEGILYEAKKNETAETIARKFGIEIGEILKIDQLQNIESAGTSTYVFLPNVKKEHKSLRSLSKPNNKYKVNLKKIRTKKEKYCTDEIDFIWPVKSRVTSGYGRRWGRFHRGIDIGAPIGTPVRAAAKGKVILAKTLGNYGKIVKLQHEGGFITTYAHLSRFNVKEGDYVDRGETLGYVGSTGKATGPHLHFEISHHRKTKNPLQYLK